MFYCFVISHCLNKTNIMIAGWSEATGRVAAVAVVLVESKHPGVPRHDPARGRGRPAHGLEAALRLLHGRPAVVQLGLKTHACDVPF
jgi:hypothetical protein